MKYDEHVERYGMSVVFVGGGSDKSFAYSVGRSIAHGSEIIFSGNARPDDATMLMNALHKAMVDGVITFKEDGLYDISTEGETWPFPFYLRRVTDLKDTKENYTCQASFYREEKGLDPEDYDIIQFAICDRAGLYPHQEGFDKTYDAKYF